LSAAVITLPRADLDKAVATKQADEIEHRLPKTGGFVHEGGDRRKAMTGHAVSVIGEGKQAIFGAKRATPSLACLQREKLAGDRVASSAR
jgi:hypothetical protein